MTDSTGIYFMNVMKDVMDDKRWDEIILTQWIHVCHVRTYSIAMPRYENIKLIHPVAMLIESIKKNPK